MDNSVVHQAITLYARYSFADENLAPVSATVVTGVRRSLGVCSDSGKGERRRLNKKERQKRERKTKEEN
jgi:hypothetical protein